jgi:undecaprenyl-diphosphatase
MSWTEELIQLDYTLFKIIQSTGVSNFMDNFMLGMREAKLWIPFYAFMLYWIWANARSKMLVFILLTVASFGLADFSSASIFKPFFARERPCYEDELEGVVRSLVGCGGKYGFPSSHASNHFALAAFWYWAIYLIKGQRWYWLFLWAFIIGYAQVYVGKHYPIDILGGGLLGIFIGTAMAKLFELWDNRKKRMANPDAVSLP